MIPALAVSQNGFRLGYGKGFYDRYLIKNPTDRTMAVLFDRFIVEEVPVESHDHAVKFICTQSGIAATEPAAV